MSAILFAGTAFGGNAEELRQIRFSPDGRYVLAQDRGAITVLTVKPFRIAFRVPAPDAELARFSPDSQNLVFLQAITKVSPYTIDLNPAPAHVERWNLAGHRRVGLAALPYMNCRSEQLSLDGSLVVCLDAEWNLRFIDVASGKTLFEKHGFTHPVMKSSRDASLGNIYETLSSVDIDFSPDGEFLIVKPENAEGSPMAWSMKEKKPLRLAGNLETLKENGSTFLAPHTLLVRDGANSASDYSRGIAHCRVMEFPSGRILSKVDLPFGSFESAADPDFVIVRPYARLTHFPGRADKKAAAVRLSTGLAVYSTSPSIHAFGKLYASEVVEGVVGFSEDGKLRSAIKINEP